MGEAGCIASTPAVVNAVVDAIRPMGVNDVVMPCTPSRVFAAIQSASTGADAITEDAAPHFGSDAPNADPAAGGDQGGDQ